MWKLFQLRTFQLQIILTLLSCVTVDDMECLRCDRFSVIVIKPDHVIKCPNDLNNAALWKVSSDRSQYMEQRHVMLLQPIYYTRPSAIGVAR